MQNDLHHGFFVLYLRYFLNIVQDYIKRFISKSKRGACTRESVEIANKPFFVPAWNVGKEAIDGY